MIGAESGADAFHWVENKEKALKNRALVVLMVVTRCFIGGAASIE